MSNDNKFIVGLFFKDPHENAPDFVMAKGSIKVADLRGWLAEQPEDSEYDAKANSYGCWLLAIEEMRKEILKEREAGR